MKILNLNDIHIGVQRKAGTTPASQEELRGYLLHKLSDIVLDSDADVLLITGDLFDTFEVSPRDWLDAFLALRHWLCRERLLWLVAGNHDWSPKGNKLSSFEALARVLQSEFPDETVVVGINEWKKLGDRYYALAHCGNQQVFDAKLDEVLAVAVEGDNVFVHCNFDNNFAAQSDHSLNISRDQAKKFVEKGVRLVFAHEHQQKSAFGDKVLITGNQWPTSVADCLGNKAKRALLWQDGNYTEIETWNEKGENGFAFMDWRRLDLESSAKFIKVTGDAANAEASDVIMAIAEFRRKSDAYVITNSVKIEGIAEADDLPESFEVAKKFDVISFIKQQFDERECALLDSLMASQA